MYIISKVLPPKGNPGFQDPKEVHKHNNKFYDAKIRNGSRVLYLGVFYKFATGVDPCVAFKVWLYSEPQKRYNVGHGDECFVIWT